MQNLTRLKNRLTLLHSIVDVEAAGLEVKNGLDAKNNLLTECLAIVGEVEALLPVEEKQTPEPLQTGAFEPVVSAKKTPVEESPSRPSEPEIIKQGKRFWTEERLQYFKENAGKTNPELAEYFGCNTKAITNARLTYKIPNPNINEIRQRLGHAVGVSRRKPASDARPVVKMKKERKRVWTEEKLELLRKYSSLSASEAAKKLGVNAQAINDARKNYNIPGPGRGSNRGKKYIKRVVVKGSPPTKPISKTEINQRAVARKLDAELLSKPVKSKPAQDKTRTIRIDSKTVIVIGIHEDEDAARKKYFENRARMEQLKKSGR